VGNDGVPVAPQPSVVQAAAEALGYEVCSVDRNARLEPTVAASVADVTAATAGLPAHIDAILVIPPSGTWSCNAARLKVRRASDGAPLNPRAEAETEAMGHALRIVQEVRAHNPRCVYFILTPRGLMRKHAAMNGGGHPFQTLLTLCRYGAPSMRPMDVWHNCEQSWARPPCRPGDPCEQVRAGSGTHATKAKAVRRRAGAGQSGVRVDGVRPLGAYPLPAALMREMLTAALPDTAGAAR
jgi:hypothetical protein